MQLYWDLHMALLPVMHHRPVEYYPMNDRYPAILPSALPPAPNTKKKKRHERGREGGKTGPTGEERYRIARVREMSVIGALHPAPDSEVAYAQQNGLGKT